MGHVSMDSVQGPYPYGLMLPQSETERLLEERSRGLGVTVERQVELSDSNEATPVLKQRFVMLMVVTRL
jgi:hypothetical protein